MQQLINDLRIEKARLVIAVTLMSGTRVDGELFVQASGHRIGELEDAREVLNSAEPFFPLALRSGETILVAKDNVHTAAVARRDVHEDESLGIPKRVEIALRDGERLAGSVIIEPLAGHTRVLDYLNRHKERFLTLFGRDSVMLINRVLVERVRPLA
jgi:hypothetical protein